MWGWFGGNVQKEKADAKQQPPRSRKDFLSVMVVIFVVIVISVVVTIMIVMISIVVIAIVIGIVWVVWIFVPTTMLAMVVMLAVPVGMITMPGGFALTFTPALPLPMSFPVTIMIA